MGCRTLSFLVAALLISLVTHRLPVAYARHVVVVKLNNGLNNRGDVDIAKEQALGADDDFSAKKGFQGRKLGGPRNMKGDNKEKADVSRLEPKGSQMKQQGLAGLAAAARRPASSAAAAGSRLRTVEMQTAGKQADPVTEIYDMLRRDYKSKASRRGPINNGEPLQEEP